MEVIMKESVIGVKKLSERYGFDKDEALKYLGLYREEKEKVKEKSKVILPFCHKIIEGNCHGIKVNYGLYTQCNNKSTCEKEIGGIKVGLCKTCLKQCDKTEDNKPQYGLIEDRMKVDNLSYRDRNGKQVVRYGNIMEKLNITREEAERAAKKQGLTIPEEEFEVKKGKRGRPKKDTSAEDTASETSSVVTEPKKRGRPKKNKEVVSTLNKGDDLIATLVAKAKTETSNSIEKVNKNEETEDEKEHEKEEEEEEEEEDSDSEEISVSRFNHKGKMYLKASDNTIYDVDTHDPIGVWDPEKNDILLMDIDSD